VFWVISVYFNIRNTLPKFCPFLLGHPVFLSFKHLRGARVAEVVSFWCGKVICLRLSSPAFGHLFPIFHYFQSRWHKTEMGDELLNMASVVDKWIFWAKDIEMIMYQVIISYRVLRHAINQFSNGLHRNFYILSPA